MRKRALKGVPVRIAIASLMLGLAACAGSSPTLPGSPGAATDLEIVVSPDAGERRATLRCDGAPSGTGYLADPGAAGAACEAVEESAGLLTESPPADRVCTEIYGGPDEATVTGALDGTTVNRAFDRTNGCGISEWDALEALLGEPSGGVEPLPYD